MTLTGSEAAKVEKCLGSIRKKNIFVLFANGIVDINIIGMKIRHV